MPTAGRLPDFVVIGAMKAGTTSLWSYLSAHPQLFLSADKELDFFVAEKNWRRGRAWYEAQFAAAPAGSLCGEVSPNYTKAPLFDGVAERMAALLPKARLVYVVRDPLRRIESHIAHYRNVSGDPRPVHELLASESTLLMTTRYASQLERFLEHYDRDSIHVMTAEDLRDDRRAALGALLRFLDVDDAIEDSTLGAELHRSASPRVLHPTLWRVPFLRRGRALQAVRSRRRLTVEAPPARIGGGALAMLQEQLADEMHRFEALTGVRVPGWPPAT